MLVQLPVGPVLTAGCNSVGSGMLALPCISRLIGRRRLRNGVIGIPVAMAVSSHAYGANHYAVLGVSRSGTLDDIKKAYRLLALKWHPDVNKDSRAGEVFKCVRLAYEVLSNEATRTQYDRELRACDTRSAYDSPDLEVVLRIYSWTELRQRMRKKRYWDQYKNSRGNSFFYNGTDEEFLHTSTRICLHFSFPNADHWMPIITYF